MQPPPTTEQLLAPILENPDLTPKTKTNYRNNCRMLETRAERPIYEVLQHPDTYAPLFRRWRPNPTSHKVDFVLILAIFKNNPALRQEFPDAHQGWLDAFKEVDARVVARYESNAPTERQRDGYVPFHEIIAARDRLPAGDIRRLLLGVYTHIRPLRADFCRIALYRGHVPRQGAEPNYILLNGRKGELVLNTYKTSKHHGAIRVELPPALMDDLLLSLEKEPRDWLFVNARHEPFKPAVFSAWAARTFERIFHRPLNLQLVRHSYISSLNFNELTVVEKKAIAADMGHDIRTQDEYRLIFTNEEQSCDCRCSPKRKPPA